LRDYSILPPRSRGRGGGPSFRISLPPPPLSSRHFVSFNLHVLNSPGICLCYASVSFGSILTSHLQDARPIAFLPLPSPVRSLSPSGRQYPFGPLSWPVRMKMLRRNRVVVISFTPLGFLPVHWSGSHSLHLPFPSVLFLFSSALGGPLL